MLAASSVVNAGCSDSRPPVDAPPATATAATTAAPSQPPPSTPPPSTAAQPAGSAGAEAPIGTATMEPDGTIVLNLRAEGPGVVGHGQMRYPKSHAEYDKVLKHLGGLKPGENKAVPPFP